jgi:hypothetical protein
MEKVMKVVIAVLLLLVVLIAATGMARADGTVITPNPAVSGIVATSPSATTTTTTTVTNGWAPAAVASVGAFYLNGNYTLLSGGFSAGTAYTWTENKNVGSAGLYLGPQSQQLAGVTTTSINAMIYVDLFKTSTGPIGLGVGTKMWESGYGFRAPSGSTTFLALGYHFI